MITIKPDTKGWEKTMGKYIALSNKLPADVANKNCRDVSLHAIQLTKFATPERIAEDLNQPSRVQPETTIAVILAQKDGSHDPDKLIKTRQNHRNVCRVGWQSSADILRPYAKGGFAPRMRSKKSLGGAQPAVTHNHSAKAEAWNNYGDGNSKITEIQMDGLEKAFQAVEADRNVYNERKLEEIANVWR